MGNAGMKRLITATQLPLILPLVCLLSTAAGCGNKAKTGNSLGERYQAAINEPNPASRAAALVTLSADQYSAGDSAGATTSLSEAAHAAAQVSPPTRRYVS